MRRALRISGVAMAALAVLGWWAFREPDRTRVPVETFADLERELDALRERSGIPGMSAAIAQDGRIVWMRGFGIADRERNVVASADTIYHLSSLTKPFASTVLLQLVEEGRLDLNAPVSQYGLTIERREPVKVWHLFSHTSDEPPGTTYRYDGNAFGTLTQVVERVTGRPFAAELADRIIRPLGLKHTAPNPGDLRPFWSLVVSLELPPGVVEEQRAVFDKAGIARAPIEAALAPGYARAWGRWIWPSGLTGPMRPMPHGITLSTTGGLVSSAADVARFSVALDDNRLLKEQTLARAWTPIATPDGRTLPYALGWFVQQHAGHKVVWHYGHMFENSTLLVKVPDRRATFVILANSDGLSRWRSLGDDANVLASPAAVLFLKWLL
jgi:CubicO group peptidase (beta-lactamase class C family)